MFAIKPERSADTATGDVPAPTDCAQGTDDPNDVVGPYSKWQLVTVAPFGLTTPFNVVEDDVMLVASAINARGGSGVAWIVQLVPFQCSANVRTAPSDAPSAAVKYRPTAVHAVAEVQDTSEKDDCVESGGAGTGWIVQLVPSQDSVSVAPLLEPTALQGAPAGAHETLESLLTVEPVGLGVGWIVQLVPFQDAANVRSPPALLLLVPTAVQDVADSHHTALSVLPADPVGLGVLWIDQLVPFQDSASVCRSYVLPFGL